MKKIKENFVNFILIAVFIFLIFMCKKQIFWMCHYAKLVDNFKLVLPFMNTEITNDTFFTIASGNNILENGLNNIEVLTWHEELNFNNPRWLFDIFISILYKNIGIERNICVYSNYVSNNIRIIIFCCI